ncbi:MAG: ribonucleoside-diphosphate reductase subunit alpha [Waddliaceae bacterium]
MERNVSVRKRDGKIVPFDRERIHHAIREAFRDIWGFPPIQELSKEQIETIQEVFQSVLEKVLSEKQLEIPLDVERIQDIVELILMRQGHYDVAKGYILYRETRAKARQLEAKHLFQMTVLLPDGKVEPFDRNRLKQSLSLACKGFYCSVEALLKNVETQLFDRMTPEQLRQVSILSARSMMEQESSYQHVTARLLLAKIDREVMGTFSQSRNQAVRLHFSDYLTQGIAAERLHPELANFNWDRLAQALAPDRDQLFPYMGLQTLYDRYLIKVDDKRIELPQYFWMRIAMGLAIAEEDKDSCAIEFYEAMSTFHYVPSTPTLFNSGTLHPQLSSCYLSTVGDDLEDIFRIISDNAKLSKWAGGLGNDWTSVRATHARIKGTNGQSQGLIPFLKVVNDTAVAVNQGGKRRGAVCCYLETWHLDIEEFLELRRNTGDERRRTHDMNTANWIPDLFMKRVEEDKEWTLFSPDEVPDLHELYGKAFEERYARYEREAKNGNIKQFRTLRAVDIWRKMLSRLFETGHPWMTWKDPSNIRSPQKHAGVVHSSNLCTEILLNTSRDETAVCNLGSINLKAHFNQSQLDHKRLEQTITTAIRMLDNVIDINFYPTPEAKNANTRHRAIGLGIMGFQDALYALDIPYSSDEAVAFADASMEAISYYATLASTKLAKERGAYSSYEGSSWSRGILPLDTIDHLEQERERPIEVNRESRMDWESVRKEIQLHGMRNSNILAVAPTATISQIVGVCQSIEPQYTNLFVKSNLSGEFTAVNVYLVETLKRLQLWDQDMLDELKYHDGSIQGIDRIPDEIKACFKTAFEVGSEWLIACAAARQKWISMGQSLNLYLTEPSGKKVDAMYRDAWKKGLKTCYYLRTRAATQVEKSTLDVNKFGVQPKWMKSKSPSDSINIVRNETASCSLETGCEACQ